MTSPFLDLFEQVVGASRHRFTPSPAELLNNWRSFVEACDQGYWYGYDGYQNDLSVRDLVETILRSEQLRPSHEMRAFEAEVSAIDAEFRVLLDPEARVGSDADPWWRRGLLARAGTESVTDVERSFGIVLSTCREGSCTTQEGPGANG